MTPKHKEAIQTALLYGLFLLVYAIIAGLIGTFVGIVTGSTPDDVLRGLWIGVAAGLALGLVAAAVGRRVPPPAAEEPAPGTLRAAVRRSAAKDQGRTAAAEPPAEHVVEQTEG